MSSAARIPDILDRMPTSEKSNVPQILNALQPVLCSIAFLGMAEAGHTREISSSVLHRKYNSPSISISSRLFSLQMASSVSKTSNSMVSRIMGPA